MRLECPHQHYRLQYPRTPPWMVASSMEGDKAVSPGNQPAILTLYMALGNPVCVELTVNTRSSTIGGYTIGWLFLALTYGFWHGTSAGPGTTARQHGRQPVVL